MSANPHAGKSSMPAAQPVASKAEAEHLVRNLMAATDMLISTIEQETALVRAGKVVQAAPLGKTKIELAATYVRETARVKASLSALKQHVPDLLAQLRKQHESFNVLLQTNLTVLATSHAVSESLIRAAHTALARKKAPQTYGRTGLAVAPPRNMAVPVSVSRTL
jgi:hypothetical protein